MRRRDPAFSAKEWVDVAAALLPWTWAPNSCGILVAGVPFLSVMLIQRRQAMVVHFNF